MSRLQQIIAGMQVIATYTPNAEVAANHDDILIACDHDSFSEEDRKKMSQLGWSWNDSYDCYQMFV